MWFQKPKPAPREPAVKFKVVTVESSKMRLHQFRSDENLCKGMAEAFRNVYVNLAVQVLNTENPSNYVLPFDASTESRACHQARCEGYNQALANLQSMAIHQPGPTPLEATFDEPEELQHLKGK